MIEVLKKIVGQEFLGFCDYLVFPKYKKSWGGPFNGQKFRQKMFLQIINCFDISLIVETGTFRGTTTEFMSNNSSAKVISVESNKRIYGYSKIRFLFNNKIDLKYNDSRKFLSEVLDDTNLWSQYIFFYLDAHWENDLPLIGELEIIFGRCQYPIIMIDDFKVPDDNGYQYDDYGDGKVLSLELIEQLNRSNIHSFFPSLGSSGESGLRKGAVVLTNSDEIKNKLLKLDSLRIFK